MNIRILFVIIILSLYFNLNNKEHFEELLVSSKDFESINIQFLKDEINKLNIFLNFIKFGTNQPKIIYDLPNELQNDETYNRIIYEMYIDNFLDYYLVSRFNINKYLNIKYNYINDYTKLYSKIEELTTNIHTIENFIFSKNSNNKIISLYQKMKIIKPNEFNDFFHNDFKDYLNEVFFNLGLNTFFSFTLKEVNNDNLVDIIDTLDLFIENEYNTFINFNS